MSAGVVEESLPQMAGQPRCNSDVTRHSEKDISNGPRSEPDGQSTEDCPAASRHPPSSSVQEKASNGPVKVGENNNINSCLPNSTVHNNNKHGLSHTVDTANHMFDTTTTTTATKQANGTGPPSDVGEAMDTVNTEVPLRGHSKAQQYRNTRSEILTSELYRRRSASMMEVKEQAHGRLQEELVKAQRELKLKDEECGKLSKVRDQMCLELEELTACLFEEANNMVQEANLKRMHSEKLQSEAADKIEVLQAEVLALKQIVLTSTPSTPNKHLHPQIETSPATKKKESRPFWKGHRRSTSHHEFTKESRQEAEARQQESVRIVEVDPVGILEFRSWRQTPQLSRNCHFLSRIVFEDIAPCLNFASKELAARVQECVENNTLTMEPISGDSSFPRKCSLSDSPKLCNYKIKLGDDTRWFPISQHCRNRIASVCDFYTYIRYIFQGLVKSEDKDVYNEIIRLRRQMALSRLGLL